MFATVSKYIFVLQQKFQSQKEKKNIIFIYISAVTDVDIKIKFPKSQWDILFLLDINCLVLLSILKKLTKL